MLVPGIAYLDPQTIFEPVPFRRVTNITAVKTGSIHSTKNNTNSINVLKETGFRSTSPVFSLIWEYLSKTKLNMKIGQHNI